MLPKKRGRTTSEDEVVVPVKQFTAPKQLSVFPNSLDRGMEVKTFLLVNVTKKAEEPLPSGIIPMTYCLENQSFKINALSGTSHWSINVSPCIERKTNNFIMSFKANNLAFNWSVQANVTLFISAGSSASTIDRSSRKTNFTKNSSLKFEIPMEEFAKFFIIPGQTGSVQLRFDLRIVITHTLGLRSRRSITYDFTKKCATSSLKLCFVENKALYVNLGFLAQQSDYFNCLRERVADLPKDPSTSLPYETLKDVDYDEFTTLLLAVYPSTGGINDQNVMNLLKLADRFLFEGVLIQLETFLMSDQSKAIDVLTKLQLSFDYDMTLLQDKVLRQLSFRDVIIKLMDLPQWNRMSPEVTKCLLERSLDKTLYLGSLPGSTTNQVPATPQIPQIVI